MCERPQAAGLRFQACWGWRLLLGAVILSISESVDLIVFEQTARGVGRRGRGLRDGSRMEDRRWRMAGGGREEVKESKMEDGGCANVLKPRASGLKPAANVELVR